MSLVYAVATARQTAMQMAFATMLILVLARWTLVGFAMALERFTSADALKSQKTHATAKAINWMLWENAEEIVLRMTTLMAFAMRLTLVLVRTMNAVFATAVAQKKGTIARALA
jgi:hypothetical protein